MDADRQRAGEGQITALKQALQAERDAYVAGHAKERSALDQRHAAEDRQLITAATHRVAQDRAREQEERRAPEIERQDKKEISRGHASQATS